MSRAVPLVLAALLASSATAAAGDRLVEAIRAARVEASVEPQRALRTVRALRTEAIAAGRLDARLAADATECRVLTDLDANLAVSVADAGLAAAGDQPQGEARSAWLRLRACRVGTLLDLGETERGGADLDALLATLEREPDAIARGLARLERGVVRSRTGDLIGGQEDLLSACALLEGSDEAADHDLCTLHLANHYRRVGEIDEALALLGPLHEKAARLRADYDDSVYVYTIAQLLALQQRWDAARDRFHDALGSPRGRCRPSPGN